MGVTSPCRRHVVDSTVKINFEDLSETSPRCGLVSRWEIQKFTQYFICLKWSNQSVGALGILGCVIYLFFRSLYTHSPIINPKTSIRNQKFPKLYEDLLFQKPRNPPLKVKDLEHGQRMQKGFFFKFSWVYSSYVMVVIYFLLILTLSIGLA